MKKNLFIFLSIMLAVCALSCSNGSDDSAQLAYLNYLALLKSKSYSARLSAALNYAAPAVTEEAPNVLLIEGDNIQTMTDAQFRQAVNVIIHGKTLVILNCSPSQIFAFGVKLKALSDKAEQDGDTKLVAMIAADSESTWSPTDFLSQVTKDVLDVYTKADPPSIFDTKIYEALGIRKNHVYYVHPTDQNLAKLLVTENSDSEQIEIEADKRVPQATATPVSSNSEEAIQASVKAFSDWILQKDAVSSNVSKSELSALLVQANQAVTPSALDMLKNAQETFTHNFMVEMNWQSANRDGEAAAVLSLSGFNGKRENIRIETKVWSVCDIDAQKDIYLVKTSAICHNEQLGFADQWSTLNRLGPYFDSCLVKSTMQDAQGKQHIDASECEPQNQSGSTTYTKGFNISIGGNLGFAGSGASLSPTASATFTDTSSRSIPDITTTMTVNDSAAQWKFAGRSFDPSPSCWIKDHPEEVADIQKKEAVFDTYSVIHMPSESGSETQTLKTTVGADIAAVFRFEKSWNIFGVNKWVILKGKYHVESTWKDNIKRPNNAKGEYVMVVKALDGATDRDKLETKLKGTVSTWGENVSYYAIGANRLDAVAKNKFAHIKDVITKNKNVFADSGIKGKYEFYIQNVSAAKKIDSFELAF